MDRLTYILDISPASGNKYVPVGLAAVAATEDPQCVVVAQASFWRLDGGSSRWSVAALASVFVVCHGKGDKSNPQVSFLAFSYSLHYFGPCLNMRYTRNILALKDLVRPMMMKRSRRWHWLVFCRCLGFCICLVFLL